jgi:hypothetical protein
MWKLTLGGYGDQWCVSHTVALPFTLKKYLKAKEEELWKTQIFHHAKTI